MTGVKAGPVEQVLIRNLLIASRAAGNPDPSAPAKVEANADGTRSYYVLDESDDVIIVTR